MDDNKRFDSLQEFARMLEAGELETETTDIGERFVLVSQEEHDWYGGRIIRPGPRAETKLIFHGYTLKVKNAEPS